MIRKPTWILLGLFAVSLALVWLVPQLKTSQPEATSTPASVNESLLNLSTAKIVSVNIVSRSGKELTLSSTGNDQFEATQQPEASPIPTDQISQLSSAVTDLSSAQVIDTLPTPPALADMGLDAPSTSLTVTFSDGSKRVIKIGNPTVTGSGYYVQVDNNSPVVASKYALDSILALATASTPGTATPGLAGTPAMSGTNQPTSAPIQVYRTPTP